MTISQSSLDHQPRSLKGRSIRVGLMVPINNTTMEGEMLGWLPVGSTVRTLRIPRGKGLLTQETLPAYKDAAIELAKQFNEDPVDVIAYGCTAAGFILGPEGDFEIAQRLSETTGKPVVTTARSMVLALQAIGAQKISLLTPYQDDVNVRLRAFLKSGDIAPVLRQLRAPQDDFRIGRRLLHASGCGDRKHDGERAGAADERRGVSRGRRVARVWIQAAAASQLLRRHVPRWHFRVAHAQHLCSCSCELSDHRPGDERERPAARRALRA